jgi:hypothetical protein
VRARRISELKAERYFGKRMVMNSQQIKALLFVVFVFFFADVAFCAPDSCTLPFAGSYRETIKKRSAGLSYQKYNNGKPIDLNQWFQLTEQLGKQLGTSRSSVPENQAIKNVEDIQVTLKAYLLAVRFEKNRQPGDGNDNEFHIEVGARPQWEGPHVIVEVTTGKPSCSARKTAWRLATADFTADTSKGNQKLTFLRIFAHPPLVLITGYVFVDGFHAHKGMTPLKWAHDSGGRGISFKKLKLGSQVNGLFEIHPVTALVAL